MMRLKPWPGNGSGLFLQPQGAQSVYTKGRHLYGIYNPVIHYLMVRKSSSITDSTETEQYLHV